MTGYCSVRPPSRRGSPALKREKRENRLTQRAATAENPIHITSIGAATPPNRRVVGHKAFRLCENPRNAWRVKRFYTFAVIRRVISAIFIRQIGARQAQRDCSAPYTDGSSDCPLSRVSRTCCGTPAACDRRAMRGRSANQASEAGPIDSMSLSIR